jgi:hypothetical protein
MNLNEHIDYHTEKIERLYKERAKVQERLHDYSRPDRYTTPDEVLSFSKQLYNFEKEIRVSIEVRVSLINIRDDKN